MKNRRLFTLITAAAMTFSTCAALPIQFSVPLSVCAEDSEAVETGKCGENLYYSLDKETGVLHIDGTGDMYDSKVQRDYSSGVAYTENWIFDIDGGFFAGRSDIISVIIGEGVTSVGIGAFEYCDSLTSVTLPDGLIKLGSAAFNDSGLMEITIPTSVTYIGNLAFSDTPWLEAKINEDPLVVVNGIIVDGSACSGDVVIPDGIVNIASGTFKNCEDITSIVIPDSLTSIGMNAFQGCTNLKSITIPDSISSIESGAFFGCENLESFNVPKGVTSIAGSLFYNCKSLKSITIPDNVTSIKGNAFCGCDSLESIVIPESVESIGAGAFNLCPSLQSITILNPACDIFPSAETFINKMTQISGGCYRVENTFTMYGYDNSTTQEYAKMYNCNFELLGEAPLTEVNGDANGDGSVSIADSVVLQRWLLGSGSLASWRNVDLCADGKIDVFDMIEMRSLLINE